MSEKRVSATLARNKFFDLIDEVSRGDDVVVVERNKKPLVKITKAVNRKPWPEVKKLLDETYGMWKDVPDEEFDERGNIRRVREAARKTVEKLRKGIY